jgi:hypothetical protein
MEEAAIEHVAKGGVEQSPQALVDRIGVTFKKQTSVGKRENQPTPVRLEPAELAIKLLADGDSVGAEREAGAARRGFKDLDVLCLHLRRGGRGISVPLPEVCPLTKRRE